MRPPSRIQVLAAAAAVLPLPAAHAFLVPTNNHPPSRRANSNSKGAANPPPEGFYDPRTNGGAWVDDVPRSAGQHEPINVVILGTSDPDVLVDQQNDGGLVNYFQSIGFSDECLGQRESVHQSADLGDGNGSVNETAVKRWDYGDPVLGTCKETIQGGNHFRYWTQNGEKANSGAIFMATSYELPQSTNHMIALNGYNYGRDWLVGNATSQSSIIPTFNLTNASSYSGQTTMNGYVYQTSVQYASDLIQNSSSGINHAGEVAVNGLPAVDGLVALMTVRILTKPANASSSATIPAPPALVSRPWISSALALALGLGLAPALL